MGISSSRIANRNNPPQHTAAAPPKSVVAAAKPPAPPQSTPKPPKAVKPAGPPKPLTMLTVTTSCGHPVTFAVNPDKPKPEYVATQKAGKCPACTKVDRLARNAAKGSAKVAKQIAKWTANSPYAWGEPGDLPVGVTITLTQLKDKTWRGECTADGLTVETTGIGPARQVPWLAGSWLAAKAVEVGTETKGE